MIRALRRSHGGFWLVLSLLLPLMFWAAWKSKRAPILMPALPQAMVIQDGEETPDWERSVYWEDQSMEIRLFGFGDRVTLELRDRNGMLEPDTLVYWGASTWNAQARLLGPSGPSHSRFVLPKNARLGGTLYLYSLGHAEVTAKTVIEADWLTGSQGGER